jgi:hypothetical protein
VKNEKDIPWGKNKGNKKRRIERERVILIVNGEELKRGKRGRKKEKKREKGRKREKE